MRIGTDGTIPVAGLNTPASAGVRGAAQSTVAGNGAAHDKVEVSAERQEIELLKKRLAELPDVRTEKVAELKQRISSGTYAVESTALADKLVASGVIAGSKGGRHD